MKRVRWLGGLLHAGAALAAALPAVRAVRHPVGEIPPEGFEALRARAENETSSACLPCHPDHHATWARTHHAQMTRDASASSIAAPFDGRPVTFHDVTTIPRVLDGRFVMTSSREEVAFNRGQAAPRLHAREAADAHELA